MTVGKNEFIKLISSSLGRTAPPESPPECILPHQIHHDYLKGADNDELEKVFISNARAAGTTIYQCNLSKLYQTLHLAITDFGSGAIVLADNNYLNEHDIFKDLANHFDQVAVWDQEGTRKENIATAEQASIGIVTAEFALAESGTVVLYSHRGSGRSISLLPTYTISLIRKLDIYPRLTQAMSLISKQTDRGLPSSINFITGASSTADIELVRVQGVHGPLAISYIIIDN